ncbi:hypothetical protein V1478_012468 [Vespula squamosa]|uniref:Uncharacterized protein n=1 Tax=Vespula squamosa TaxID=30214 RepID=A0ABD2AD96_VESSQ
MSQALNSIRSSEPNEKCFCPDQQFSSRMEMIRKHTCFVQYFVRMSSTLFFDMRGDIMKNRSTTWSLGQRRANIPGQTRNRGFIN